MNRRDFLAVAVSGAGIGTLGCSCSTTKHNSTVSPISGVKLFTSLTKSGTARPQSDAIANGIQLALEGHGGKVAGLRSEIVARDNTGSIRGEWDAEAEKKNAADAVSDPSVMAYIGPLSAGAAKMSMPILSAGGLLHLSPSCTWPGLTKRVFGDQSGEPNVYRKGPAGKLTFCRVCPTDFAQGPAAAAFAKAELKVGKVYILHDRELYGAGVANSFAQRCETLGIQVLGQEGLDTSRNDFRAILGRIKAQSPDLLYFGGTVQSKGGQLAKDMVSEGLACPLFVPEGCHEHSFLEALEQAKFGDRCYTTVPGVDPAVGSGGVLDFAKRYRDKFNIAPTTAALYGYEAAMAFAAVANRGGKKDREAIRHACFDPIDFTTGALGPWRFDADGDTTLQAATVYRAYLGAYSPVRPMVERSQ